MVDFLSTLITSLPSTSAITVKKLQNLGINNYIDLLNYFPSRYENYSVISPINKIQEGEAVTVIGKLVEAKNQYTRTRITIQKIIIRDDTGIVEVNWFNQPYLIRVLKIGESISVAGIVKQFGAKMILDPKEYEVINFDRSIDRSVLKHTGRLIPIYPEKRGISSRTIREKIYAVLDKITQITQQEILPDKILKYNNLISENEAIQQIHFPTNTEIAKKARERLAFDELFYIQLANDQVKKEWKKERVGNKFELNDSQELLIKKFIEQLPFVLTSDQRKVAEEIISDLKKTSPMNRFLQGDVGSGKTVVALISCYLSFLNGYQSLIMAPTEILATQHYQTIKKLFANYGLRITLITGSIKIRNPQSEIEKSNIIIGTHALLSKKNRYNKVGLVVIDEQHRFGVNQRAFLKEKALNPHLLTMTATPIPRTVALTLYGELDQSYIEEMPRGRQTIKTFLIPKNKRSDGYEWIKKKIKLEGAQVFIVCPLIEESETETLKSVKAVKMEFDNIKKVFPEFRLGLLHGKIKSEEKQKIMSDFKDRKIDILLSTPVVEVGIDIPGATIMIIEGAERFGLAQLHQLRGRVGRSSKQSYCLLYSENLSEKTVKRLKFFCNNNLGVRLAEFDLKNRGAGNIFGTEQHGFVNLRIADLYDFELITKTKKAVEYFSKNYDIKDWKELYKKVQKNQGGMITND